MVSRQVELPWRKLDWRHLSEAEYSQCLADLQSSERKEGFDVNCAPLFKLVFIERGEDFYQLIWTHHHVLLDGWSLPIVFETIAFKLPSPSIRL